jgi:hypothetical protein
MSDEELLEMASNLLDFVKLGTPSEDKRVQVSIAASLLVIARNSVSKKHEHLPMPPPLSSEQIAAMPEPRFINPLPKPEPQEPVPFGPGANRKKR